MELELENAHFLVKNNSRVTNIVNLNNHLDNIVLMINLVKQKSYSKTLPWKQTFETQQSTNEEGFNSPVKTGPSGEGELATPGEGNLASKTGKLECFKYGLTNLEGGKENGSAVRSTADRTRKVKRRTPQSKRVQNKIKERKQRASGIKSERQTLRGVTAFKATGSGKKARKAKKSKTPVETETAEVEAELGEEDKTFEIEIQNTPSDEPKVLETSVKTEPVVEQKVDVKDPVVKKVETKTGQNQGPFGKKTLSKELEEEKSTEKRSQQPQSKLNSQRSSQGQTGSVKKTRTTNPFGKKAEEGKKLNKFSGNAFKKNKSPFS